MTDRRGGRVALISGASRGIGDHIGAALLQQGWLVSLGMRTPVLPSWAVGREKDVHLFSYDANDAAETRWTEDALRHFGRIDAIVANAGIMIPKTVIEANDDDIDAMLSVNVKAPRRLVKAAWNALCESGRGRVIILASLSGKRVKSASAGSYSLSNLPLSPLPMPFGRRALRKGCVLRRFARDLSQPIWLPLCPSGRPSR